MQIRVRYNYNSIAIDHNGKIVDGHKSLAGPTVSVLHKNGRLERYTFGGFEDAALYRNSLLEFQLVKVVEVLSFIADDSPPSYIQPDSYLVGVFNKENRTVKLLLESGAPISNKLNPRKQSKPDDNVVSLRPAVPKK